MFTSYELMDQAQAIAMEAVAAITADRVLQAGQEAFFGAIGNRRVVRSVRADPHFGEQGKADAEHGAEWRRPVLAQA